MRFIECAAFTRLNVLLENVHLGDRVINARLELFDTASQQEPERRLSEQLEEDLTNHNAKWLADSPLGPLHKHGSKELLVNLISSMNSCFPDYDFSTLTPVKFRHNEDFGEVCSIIQAHFSNTLERLMPGLLPEIWTAINECLSMSHVEVYSYVADSATDADPFSENDCISSFDFFFVKKKNKRIVNFSSMTKSKFCSSPANSDRDETDLTEEYYGARDTELREEYDLVNLAHDIDGDEMLEYESDSHFFEANEKLFAAQLDG